MNTSNKDTVNTEVNESNPTMSPSSDISQSNESLPDKVISIESILAKAANEPDCKEAENGWESSCSVIAIRVSTLRAI